MKKIFDKRPWSLVAIFMLFAVLPLSAAISSAQNLVTLRLNNATLETFFDAMRQQTGNVFVYSTSDIDTDQRVSVDSRGEAVTDVLDRVLGEKNLSYSITDNYVVVRTQQQPTTATVSGTVRDSEGNPLAHAAVMVAGTAIGVSTDAQGRYELRGVPAGATLRFSLIGMSAREVVVGNRTQIDVTLQDAVINTERVIVTGYQTISSDRATGSFGSISEADMANRLSPNFQSILEGQVTGMMMGKNNRVEIRGVSTFMAGGAPLIVVDGFPIEASQYDNVMDMFGITQTAITGDGTLDNVNYDNVANITVLKDGVAASIYGSRAANGVIVITTKNGMVGKPRVTYKGVFGVKSKNRVEDLNFASTSDYIDGALSIYDENSFFYAPDDYQPINEVIWLRLNQDYGMMSDADVTARIDALRGNNFAKDVEKHLFRNEMSHHHTVGLSGGSESATYNASVQYVDTRGNFVHSNSDRVIVDLKNTFRLNKFLSAQMSANVTYSKLQTPMSATNEDQMRSNYLTYNATASNNLFQPYTSMFNADGSQANIIAMHPYKLEQYAQNTGMKDASLYLLDDIGRRMMHQSNFQSRLNGQVRAQIIEGLNAEVGGSWQRGSYMRRNESKADAYALRVAYNDGTSLSNPANHYFPDGDMIDEVRAVNDNWTVRSQLNFSRGFNADKHRVNAIFGNEIRRTMRDMNTMDTRLGYNSIAGSYAPVNYKDYNSGVYDADMFVGYRGINLTNGSYLFRDNRFVSWYGNGSYEFDDRFIVSASIRLDNTNLFGTDPKYRHRPMWSVGGTWKIANEKFFNVKWVDMLNLRASYGVNGNIALNEGPFLILSAGDYNPRTGGISYGIASPPNYSLRWERTKTSNVGLDLALLGSRLTMSVDLYNRNSDDLLAPYITDRTTGFRSITRNVGSIRNRGVEISLGGTPVATDNFRWSVNANLSYNKNKVLSYDTSTTSVSTMTMLGAREVAGYPASGLWVYRFAGLDESGNMMAYNKAGEKIDPGTATIDDLVYGGTTRPTTELALTNRFTYKNWDLSFMLIGRFGHKFVADHFDGSELTASNRHLADRWREPGDEAHTIYPALSYWAMNYWYFPYSDVLIKNAGYAKLRDVTLGYTFGKKVTSALGIGGMKVYVQARNLLTFTAKGVDVDPETVDMSTNGVTGFKIPREFYAGVQITF